MKKIILIILALLLPCSLVFSQPRGGTPPTKYQEKDGSPSLRARTVIVPDDVISQDTGVSDRIELLLVGSVSADVTYLRLDTTNDPLTNPLDILVGGKTLTLTGGAITDSSGDISFGDENLTTTGYESNKNFTDSYHYTGFPNRTDTSLSWDDATYTLTLTATNDKIWISGVEYTINTLTSQTADTTGFYWFWITAPGGVPQLNNSTTTPDIGAGGANAGFDQCLVATTYWNTSLTAPGLGLMSENRHWVGRDAWWHEYTHETIGARYFNGMAGTFDNTTLTVESGEFYDEDIEHVNTQQTVATVLYKNGDANWAWLAANTEPYKVVNPGVDDTLQYNNGNALASVGNAQFVNSWVYITGDTAEPVKIIIGQATFGTIAGARAEDPSTLSLGTLPSEEIKLIFKITYKNVGGNPTYQETTDFRAVTTLPTGTYIPTQHSTLAGLTTGDDHTQYVLADGSRAMEKLQVDSIHIDDTIISSDSGTISFDNDAILTTGTLGAGATTLTGTLDMNANVIDNATTINATSAITGERFNINDSNTQISEDGSSNMSFTDAVTGRKTLAELAAGSAPSGTLSGVNYHMRFTIIDPLAVQTEDNEICLVVSADAALDITRLEVTLDSVSNDVAGDLKWADTFIGLGSAAVINDFDTTSGVRTDDSITSKDVAAGKAIYIAFDSAPSTVIKQMCVDLTYTYD